jgi:hypothetical protein
MLRKNELRSVINETILDTVTRQHWPLSTADVQILVDMLETNIKRMWDKEDV